MFPLSADKAHARVTPINGQHYRDMTGTSIRNRCANERMIITNGSILVVLQGVITPKKIPLVWNDAGSITAVDAAGNIYHGIYLNNYHINDDFAGPSYTTEQVINILINTPGSGKQRLPDEGQENSDFEW